MKKPHLLIAMFVVLAISLPFVLPAQAKQKAKPIQNPIKTHLEKQIRNTYGYGKPTKIILTKASLTSASDLFGDSVDVSGMYNGKLLQASLIDAKLPLYDKTKQQITIYRYNRDKYYSSNQGTLDY